MSGNSSHAADAATVTIRSEALVGGTLDVTVKRRRQRRRLVSGRRLKDLIVPTFVWFLRAAPRPLALLPVNTLLSLARLLYWLPSNPLRRAATDMSVICRAHGRNIEAQEIYRAILDNAHSLAIMLLRLYRDGRESATEGVYISAADTTRIQKLIDQYGGVAVAVPHNIGSAFSGICFVKLFPSVLVGKNPSSVRRTRIALDFFERIGAKVLMVRDGNAMRISRSLIKLLRSGKVVTLTSDLLVGPKDGIVAKVFGEPVWFPAWLTRIPTATGVPIVPAYVHSVGSKIHIAFGSAIRGESGDDSTAEIAAFLEERILDDPASWAFMADKRWSSVLAAAAARLQSNSKVTAASASSSEL